jgi:biotin carboxylase
MKHILFVDANVNGLLAVEYALDSGHCVSYLQPDEADWYPATPRNQAILARLHEERRVPRDAMLDAVLAINAQKKLDAVVAVFERSIDVAAQAAERLGLIGPSTAAITRCRDKHAVRAALSKQGVPNVLHATANSLEQTLKALEHVGLPSVIKPRFGAGSMMCAVLRKASDSERFWREIDARAACLDSIGSGFVEAMRQGFLIESYIEGQMLSVEIASRRGRHTALMLSERVRSSADELIDYRINMPAALGASDAQACVAYAGDVLDAIGLTDGIFHVELMLTDAGPLCVEVNPRLMGGYMPVLYNNVSGRNVYEELLAIHLSGCLPEAPDQLVRCGAAVRFEAASGGTADIGVLLEAVARDSPSFPFFECDAARAAPSVIDAGKVLARVQVLAGDRESLDARVESLFETLGAAGTARLLR